MSRKELMEMVEGYKNSECPDCGSSNLSMKGMAHVEGDNWGQLYLECEVCETEFNLNVFSLVENR